MTVLAAARALRDRGFVPLPLVFCEKKPAVPRWPSFEPTDRALEERVGVGLVNVGLLLGPRSRGLVDIDLDHPTARRLACRFLPATPMRHGRASAPGSHWWYVAEEPVPTEVFRDPTTNEVILEIRGTNAQTMVPPSIHPSGEPCQWEQNEEPARISATELWTTPRRLAAAALLAIHWRRGARHNSALAVAGALIRAGWSEEQARELVLAIAEAAGDEEAAERLRDVSTTRVRLSDGAKATGAPTLARIVPEVVVRQAFEWLGVRGPVPTAKNTRGGVPVSTRLSEVEPQAVEWLWPGRLALGKLTILDGDPGVGKSTITADLAARVSTGDPMPFSTERRDPAGVVIVSCEDGVADTIVPRLDAARADRARICHLRAVRDAGGLERLLTIPEDLEAIRQVVIEYKAVLLIIDPLFGYIGTRTNTWKDQDVRLALAPLGQFAEETAVSVLVVRHLTKGDHEKAIRAGGGSIGIIGQARTALLVERDPEDSDGRILAVTKCNLGREAAALRFKLQETPLADLPDAKVVRVEWTGESDLTADDLIRGAAGGRAVRHRRREAAAFLQDLLSQGPVPAEVVEQESRARAIATATLGRAKRELGVQSDRRETLEGQGIDLGRWPDHSGWFWSLPAKPFAALSISDDDEEQEDG